AERLWSRRQRPASRHQEAVLVDHERRDPTGRNRLHDRAWRNLVQDDALAFQIQSLPDYGPNRDMAGYADDIDDAAFAKVCRNPGYLRRRDADGAQRHVVEARRRRKGGYRLSVPAGGVAGNLL